MSKVGAAAFDFGEYYADADRAQPVNPWGLVTMAPLMEAFLRAGYAKASLPGLRNAMRLLEEHFRNSFKLNASSKSFDEFVGFVCRRVNCLLYHLKRLQDEKQFEKYAPSLEDADLKRLKQLLELLKHCVIRSPSRSPTNSPSEQTDGEQWPSFSDVAEDPESETCPAEDEETPVPRKTALDMAKERQGLLSGARGSLKRAAKAMRKPAKATSAESPGANSGLFRIGKFTAKAYIQTKDAETQKWKLLVNVDYSNCDAAYIEKCHQVVDKLHAHLCRNPETSKEELRKMRDDHLKGGESKEIKPPASRKVQKTGTAALKKPACSAAPSAAEACARSEGNDSESDSASDGTPAPSNLGFDSWGSFA